jgi:hypothetical protein
VQEFATAFEQLAHRASPAKSKSELLYHWRFTASQFILASSPLRLMTRDFFPLRPCSSTYVTSSRTRRCVCLLRILLGLSSSVLLPEDHIRGKAFADGVEDPAIKNPAAAGRRENTERGSQAGPRAAGRAPRSQTQKHEHQDILGEPIAPNRAKRPKTIGILEICRDRLF